MHKSRKSLSSDHRFTTLNIYFHITSKAPSKLWTQQEKCTHDPSKIDWKIWNVSQPHIHIIHSPQSKARTKTSARAYLHRSYATPLVRRPCTKCTRTSYELYYCYIPPSRVLSPCSRYKLAQSINSIYRDRCCARDPSLYLRTRRKYWFYTRPHRRV